MPLNLFLLGPGIFDDINRMLTTTEYFNSVILSKEEHLITITKSWTMIWLIGFYCTLETGLTVILNKQTWIQVRPVLVCGNFKTVFKQVRLYWRFDFRCMNMHNSSTHAVVPQMMNYGWNGELNAGRSLFVCLFESGESFLSSLYLSFVGEREVFCFGSGWKGRALEGHFFGLKAKCEKTKW